MTHVGCGVAYMVVYIAYVVEVAYIYTHTYCNGRVCWMAVMMAYSLAPKVFGYCGSFSTRGCYYMHNVP